MKILEHRTVDFAPDTHVTFIRVETEDLSVTIKDIITVLSNLSWISKFDNEYVRSSFEVRAKDTAEYLARNLKLNKDDSVTSNTGEYVVSELAREAIVQKLGYLDIPLAELFKEQVVGNPGFDYYSANSEDIIVFGEAKSLFEDYLEFQPEDKLGAKAYIKECNDKLEYMFSALFFLEIHNPY